MSHIYVSSPLRKSKDSGGLMSLLGCIRAWFGGISKSVLVNVRIGSDGLRLIGLGQGCEL